MAGQELEFGPFIFGCAGTVLNPEEERFFQRANPFGFILFARNITSADQLKTLCASTTSETLVNAKLAKGWLQQNGVAPDAAMVAVTAYQNRAVDWGIDPARIFDFDEGVGGRYSLCCI